MAGKIPDETLEAIRDRVSIVEVVSGYVSLKKAGRNFVGLCPFHSEKTPSFTVSDERGLFHCFGCGAGGSVFTFVMRIENCEFPQAVEALARRAGVQIPERESERKSRDDRESLLWLNDFAQRYFLRSLESEVGEVARAYLVKRGLQPETIHNYGIGFCPRAGSGFAAAISAKPRAVEAALQIGLLGRRSDGSVYERLWNRVTFPIRDRSGRIAGFGGRTLGEDPPKYLNSPESSVFHKGRILYGLFEARKAVRDAQRIVIVEGYMDALALVEAGVGFVVASLGTALTAPQLATAGKFAPDIVAFFDGDAAGERAAERAFEVCLEAKVWGFGAFLPKGVDPDTYVRKEGVEAVTKLLDQAIPLWNFFLDRIDPGPQASLPERARAAEQLASVIHNAPTPAMFEVLAREAAQQLRVDESIFRTPRRGGRAPVPVRPDNGAVTVEVAEDFRREELTLIEAMSLDRGVAERVAESDLLARLESTTLSHAGAALISAWERDGNCEGALDRLPVAIAGRVAAALLGDGVWAAADRTRIADDCIRRIEQRAKEAERRVALARLREVEAGGDAGELRKELERSTVVLRQREDPRQ